MNILPCWKLRQSRSLSDTGWFYRKLWSFALHCSRKEMSAFPAFSFLPVCTHCAEILPEFGKRDCFFRWYDTGNSALFHLGAGKKCLSAKNDLCTFWWRKKSASDLLWSKYVSSRNQPEAVSSQKHSAVQAESYLSEMRAESACFQGCSAFISCLAVVIFLNPRHGFLCTHLPYPCTGLPI